MAKIFLIISIVITLLTAGLAFVTKGKVDDLNRSILESRSTVSGLRSDKTKLTSDLKKTTEDLTAANKTVDEQKDQLTEAATALTAAKGEAEKNKMALDEDEKKVTDLTTERDALQAKIDTLPKGADPAMLAAMQDENTKMKTELAEARQVQDTLKQRDKESEEKTASLSKELDRYKKGIIRNSLTGRVVAVDRGWNFVVVDVGDRRGAVVNTQLLVTRGGQSIARLKITSVEPTTSIADVVPGSLGRGQSVQPGDTVVYAGRTPSPDEAPANGTPAPGPGTNVVPAPSLPTSALNP